MTENIRVVCLTDRWWDPATMTWQGVESAGTLIDVSVQSADDHSGDLLPVGIVMLDSGAFQSVPMEFITKEEAE
jgi:hypothetical protein